MMCNKIVGKIALKRQCGLLIRASSGGLNVLLSQRMQRMRTRHFSSSLSKKDDNTDDQVLRIGFVGLGNMGLPMTLNLLKATSSATTTTTSQQTEESQLQGRHEIWVHDLHAESCAIAAQEGARVADSLEDIVRGSSLPHLIFTMLPGDGPVNAVLGALLEEIQLVKQNEDKGVVIVDSSTVSPQTSRHWHEQFANQGHAMLDAPVSGGVAGASQGTLTFMVGCDEPWALARAQPYLNLLGKRVVECGPGGTGAATKLCNNLALAAQMIGVCEALNLGEALGVDPSVLTHVMNTSTAHCWSLDVNNPHPDVAEAMMTMNNKSAGPPATRAYQGGFGAKLMLKDLQLAMQSADQAGCALPLTATSKELYRMVDKHGLGNKDFGVMLPFLKGGKIP